MIGISLLELYILQTVSPESYKDEYLSLWTNIAFAWMSVKYILFIFLLEQLLDSSYIKACF